MGDAPAATNGTSRLVWATVAAGILAGGGYVLSDYGNERTGVSDDPAPTSTSSTAPVDGTIVRLPPTTVSLADGGFVKLGLAVHVVGAAAEPVKDDHAASARWARVLDLTISTFADRTADELTVGERRDALREELRRRIDDAYNGTIDAVYFTEFIVQ